MKVEVDKHTCIGAGQCVLTAPDVFDQDDDDATVVLLDEQPTEHQQLVRDAAAGCPSGAITVHETG